MPCDVGINCFDGPGVQGISGNDVSIASLCSRVGDWGIGTGSNGFTNNRWPWIDRYEDLEGLSNATSCNSGGRGNGVGDGLNRIGDVGECL